MDEGVNQPLLVFIILLVGFPLKLRQHEKQLVASIGGRCRWLLDGFHTETQSGFLFFQFPQAGREARTAGAVLYGAQNVILLFDTLLQLGFQHIFFRVYNMRFSFLHCKDVVSDLLQFARGQNVFRGGGNNQVLQKGFFDIPFIALADGVIGTGIVIVLFPVLTGATDPLHSAAAHLAIQLAGKHIVGGLGFHPTAGLIFLHHGLRLVPQLTVDDGGDGVFHPYIMGFADIGPDILLIGDDAQHGVFIERPTGGSANALGVQIGHDLGGGAPSGILLKNIAHGRSLALVDHIVVVFVRGEAQRAISPQALAFQGAFTDASAQLLRELGAVILCEAFHEPFQNDAFRAIYAAFGGVVYLDPVLTQPAFIDRAVIAVAGKPVRFPADQGIKGTLVTVLHHPLELGPVVCFAGNVAVNIFVADCQAVGLCPRHAIPALPLYTLFSLAAAAAVPVVGHQALVGTGGFVFSWHKKNPLLNYGLQ